MTKRLWLEFGTLFARDVLAFGFYYEGITYMTSHSSWSWVGIPIFILAGAGSDFIGAKVKSWSVRSHGGDVRTVNRRFAKWTVCRFSILLAGIAALFARLIFEKESGLTQLIHFVLLLVALALAVGLCYWKIKGIDKAQHKEAIADREGLPNGG